MREPRNRRQYVGLFSKYQGRNVKRFWEMLGINQQGFAIDLGDDRNQKKISTLEQKEVIDDPLLEQIAGLLKVPVAAIKNFDEEAAIVYFKTFNDNEFTDNSIGHASNCTFNPLDKFVEAMEENKKLHERLLQVEREKSDLLQKILESK